ncbi:type II toxin-antitoxin system VapC family toxin [Phytoactinopolyspora mesophila]|uniref:Ribonuclease VapC n=1 Tax=Phytoactinopolyspora mesophila TaxID=2650750 RepID=A0A7K3M1I9_9ACTN|nr:type II toxin-antitoxin system VapC family toxin [Phytoactinopolyspora mesophila]NDL56762.1 PIN domain-containing protein [Phytoactinopolyspora mesophila]
MTEATSDHSVVLDTHVLVWLVAGESRLPRAVRQAIENASYGAGVNVSAISLWEIAMLVAKERLQLRRDVGEWIGLVAANPALTVVPLAPEIAVASTRLPGEIHRDPADRIIIATTRTLNSTLVTADGALLDYGAAGHVRTMHALVGGDTHADPTE